MPRQDEGVLKHLKKIGLNIGLIFYREGEEAYASYDNRIQMPYEGTEGKCKIQFLSMPSPLLNDLLMNAVLPSIFSW